MKLLSLFLLTPFCSLLAMAGLDDGLLAYWPLENNLNDQQNNHHLSNAGSVAFQNGRFGQGAHFDGQANAYLILNNAAALSFGEGSFSVSLWVKPEAGFKNGRLADHRGTGGNGQYPGWQFRLRGENGQWHFRGSTVDDGQGNFANCSGCGDDYGLDEWFHVAMVYRADQVLEFYVNGQLDGTRSVASIGSLDNSHPFTLGAAIVKKGVLASKSTNRYRGMMDEVRLYNRDLSPEEVFALFAQPTTPPAPPVVDAYVDFLGELAAANHSLGFIYLDSDTSGNGIPDFFLTGEDDDLDGDGLANRADDDDDGDGIPDIDDKAGYDVPTGSAAGRAPLTGTSPASLFANGTLAQNAGLHPGDFWQFVPNGIHEQDGSPYTDSQGRTYSGIYRNPAAYLYVDQYDRNGNLLSDGIPDMFQASVASPGPPAFVLEQDHETTFIDGSTAVPGLLGSWAAGETGQTIFYLSDDDATVSVTSQYQTNFPYLSGGMPIVTDIYATADGLPDYDLYGTTDELDPAIPDSLKTDDPTGTRLWRYRKLVGEVSSAREVVYFLSTYFQSGGRPVNTYYSRGAFNETFGNFGPNARTFGDGYGVGPGETGVGTPTPDNWFPAYRSLSQHDLVAQYAFGQNWADVATAPLDGSAPIALDPADQAWVDTYENFSTDRRVINHLDFTENLMPVSSDIATLLLDRYGLDLAVQDNRAIIKREAGGNTHHSLLPIGSGFLLSWEDLFAGGDRNFSDVVFYTNLPTSEP